MKSLFLKIFLSFWMAQALFVALAMVAAIAPQAYTFPNLNISGYQTVGTSSTNRAFSNYFTATDSDGASTSTTASGLLGTQPPQQPRSAIIRK